MANHEAATDAQVERWAETGTGYTVEGNVVHVANGGATEHYAVTATQAKRLEQAAGEHSET